MPAFFSLFRRGSQERESKNGSVWKNGYQIITSRPADFRQLSTAIVAYITMVAGHMKKRFSVPETAEEKA
jgi:hypothetical protein